MKKDFWDSLSDEEFDIRIRSLPWDVLFYEHPCKRLSDEQLIYCLRRSPPNAIEFKHVCDRLSDEQFNSYVKECPSTVLRALRCPHIHTRISIIQLDNCVKFSPGAAEKYADVLLTPYQKAWIQEQ
jgi:hypothetical protein